MLEDKHVFSRDITDIRSCRAAKLLLPQAPRLQGELRGPCLLHHAGAARGRLLGLGGEEERQSAGGAGPHQE